MNKTRRTSDLLGEDVLVVDREMEHLTSAHWSGWTPGEDGVTVGTYISDLTSNTRCETKRSV